ncbi:hypothetical protein JI59_18685 [Novosphingobium pentaromativorans US6-1]|uniref:Uncharacterized protein n=2 Tax=Novosphingobium pentaromativorans TaxID=205844 RepID=G6E7F2_9SPHN|nr:hypothetical protein JI59_18685 [Novosphingobium pentaromativorans US6-1]EHJ62775.1 hypothetical protein NSU_0287 [Novosphingobium pentaromativorans US6-1]
MDGFRPIMAPGGVIVALISTFFGRKADEDLIAAAPELYAELFLARDEVAEKRDVIFDCHTIGGDPDTLEDEARPDLEHLDAQLARIDSALAKARGEA